MNYRELHSTNYPITFLMVASADHITGLAGAAPVVTLSKNGAAFAPAAGAISEIGDGWYALAGAAADRDTLGDVLLHATAAAADPMDLVYTVWDWDPFSGTAENVWSYNGPFGRSLSAIAPAVHQTFLNGEIFLVRGDTLSLSITDLGPLVNRAKVWFTLKAERDDLDAQAVVQIEETAGLIYLNGTAAIAGDGSLTVTDPARGNITIYLKPAASRALPVNAKLFFDVQLLDLAGEVFTKMSGRAPVISDITRAIA